MRAHISVIWEKSDEKTRTLLINELKLSVSSEKKWSDFTVLEKENLEKGFAGIVLSADNKGDLIVQKVNSNATKIILPVKIA